MTTIRAAGGVVWRPDPGDPRQPEFAVVHRPRYDDWSLPKGKLKAGEHPMAAAVREVFEEAGVRAVPQLRLPEVRYRVTVPADERSRSRDAAEAGASKARWAEKLVSYWSMRAVSWTDRSADHEVDEVRWVNGSRARKLLSYAHDRKVMREFLARPAVTGVVALVRHARAGEREGWSAPDLARPLDRKGRCDAATIVDVLALFGPGRILTATPARCAQTVAPLATRLGLDIERDARFDEGADPRTAAEALQALARGPAPVVVCSQGKMIPPLLGTLTGRQAERFRTRKGDGWLLAFSGGRLVGTDPLSPND